ncbi:uncharacterized protein LOC121391591 [Gigantopelta aegis]|uniref:uncharacterized protein LOC121391591 n=1 Tax=Gigantopelta aegis TaxID=1735272 RepID=UPI001B889D3B|nr:uncharacterized protein LOC121391591 [Gigantopelta aegis]
MTVNDCHGEVIVKRAFQRYLYQQLSLCLKIATNDSIFQLAPSSGKCTGKSPLSLVKPIFFKSIVVGKNYNYEHMARAMYVRVEAVQENEAFPESYRASAPLVGKANTSTYEQAKQSSSYSLNWWEGVMLEVIDTSIGCAQGLASEYQSVKQILRRHYSDYLGPWIQTRSRGQNDFTINQ